MRNSNLELIHNIFNFHDTSCHMYNMSSIKESHFNKFICYQLHYILIGMANEEDIIAHFSMQGTAPLFLW
jgi:hypothetical protein